MQLTTIEQAGQARPVPQDQTTAGNYFISNYPPYSFWTPEHAGEALAALDRLPASDIPLGVYLHIPFCRKRCHFCYFKVYTDKPAPEVKQEAPKPTPEPMPAETPPADAGSGSGSGSAAGSAATPPPDQGSAAPAPAPAPTP